MRCPKCKRTYNDTTLIFCLQDGEPLEPMPTKFDKDTPTLSMQNVDERKIRAAVSMLRAIADELPDDDIEEKYVEMYHENLTDIQDETEHDLSRFFIPTSELHHRNKLTGHRNRFGGFETAPSMVRYCDREMFLITIKGAIHYLNSWISLP